MQTTKTLVSDIRYIKGVGPKRAETLAKVGIQSIHDLLYYFPRRYDDRSQTKKVSELVIGDTVTVKAEVLKVTPKRFGRINRLELRVGDETGAFGVTWFNKAYLKDQIKPGDILLLYGKVELYKKKIQMNSPEFEKFQEDAETVHTSRLIPIYPLTEGLFQKSLRATLKLVVDNYLNEVVTDFLPEDFRREHGLLDLSQAVKEMHFPENEATLARARHRIVFDEFLMFEITLLKKLEIMRTRKHAYPLIAKKGDIYNEFLASLPFDATECQSKAMRVLQNSIAHEVPMNRLLMGDVGSGKTVVAAFAALCAIKAGAQTVVLVPTEILSKQHYESFRQILKKFNVEVRLLTSGVKTDYRNRLKAELKNGKVDCLVGTHAVLRDDLIFKKLGLVIIDEQHKFGVEQRNKLLNAKIRPHQLVMTATPIPRTLALTAYAELEITALKTMPKGRQQINTYWIHPDKKDKVYEHFCKKIKNEKEQAYIIFPLVEETEKIDILAATEEYERLVKEDFKSVRVGLVHGKMHPDERHRVMQMFKEHALDVLVATSVIEVGIDNPNATMMIIENAERFGLSQLHQMRGRIGRGSKASECFLFGLPKTDEGKKRLRLMTRVYDGFKIAEEDLKLRGPGDFWGTRQSGEPLFRVANPYEDFDILESAKQAAENLIKQRKFEESGWNRLKNYLDQFPIHY